MQFFIGSSVFILGAIVGSFLNVLVLRRGTGLGLLRGSFCFSCGERLAARDLIPVVSFFMQEGKCRMCRSAISLQYPFVEIATGALFLAVAHKTGLLLPGFHFLENPQGFIHLFNAAYFLLVASILFAIVIYDMRHKIIPNPWVYFFNFLAFFSLFSAPQFWDPFIAGIILFLLFASLWYFSGGRWMGLGDGKLALGIGWLAGFSSGIAAVILSFWFGALVGIAILLAQKLFQRSAGRTMDMKSEVPFAPFLVAGFGVVWFFELSFESIQSLFLF